jgi:hypothetical protein
MAYTFGAGTGDDLTWTLQVSMGATARSGLVCGWWYPTTLTATRGLWSAGNTFGAEIDATTSEIRLRTDNTTDGQWTTTGAGLATDQWTFLAFMSTQLNTGSAAAWRVWSGTIGTAPQECTVTNAVAPSGNFTGATSFYIGNKGTGALAFQGDIDHVTVISSGAAAVAASNPFSIATNGAITDEQALFTYQRYVLPIWLGQLPTVGGRYAEDSRVAATSGAVDTSRLDLRAMPQVMRYQASVATVFSGVTPTINGATYSQNRGPRPFLDSDLYPRAA